MFNAENVQISNDRMFNKLIDECWLSKWTLNKKIADVK